ncbi:unnamed protein product [Nezara viridula]|uniref:Uncharacterized protein n=1 Tax=Nezara viridula TaxID=85310 RepID=A0A9P0HKS5_NEZVI|nr:unnamed protein product [Nezara viridula]
MSLLKYVCFQDIHSFFSRKIYWFGALVQSPLALVPVMRLRE